MYEQLTSIWTIRTRKHEKIIIAICWEKHGGEAKVEGVLKSNEQKQQGPDSGDILHAQRVECKVTFGNKLSLGPLYCWARTTRTQFSCCSLYIYTSDQTWIERPAIRARTRYPWAYEIEKQSHRVEAHFYYSCWNIEYTDFRPSTWSMLRECISHTSWPSRNTAAAAVNQSANHFDTHKHTENSNYLFSFSFTISFCEEFFTRGGYPQLTCWFLHIVIEDRFGCEEPNDDGPTHTWTWIQIKISLFFVFCISSLLFSLWH